MARHGGSCLNLALKELKLENCHGFEGQPGLDKIRPCLKLSLTQIDKMD